MVVTTAVWRLLGLTCAGRCAILPGVFFRLFSLWGICHAFSLWEWPRGALTCSGIGTAKNEGPMQPSGWYRILRSSLWMKGWRRHTAVRHRTSASEDGPLQCACVLRMSFQRFLRVLAEPEDA